MHKMDDEKKGKDAILGGGKKRKFEPREEEVILLINLAKMEPEHEYCRGRRKRMKGMTSTASAHRTDGSFYSVSGEFERDGCSARWRKRKTRRTTTNTDPSPDEE